MLVRAVSVAMAVSVVACGGSTARPAVDPTETGTETETERPGGPVPSVMYAEPDLSIRIDVTALRGSPLAPDLTSAYAAGGLFSQAVVGAGVDPVVALEAVSVTAVEVSYSSGGIVSPRWRIAGRHRLGEAGVRDALERAAVAMGSPLVWRDSQGVPSARLPLSSHVHAVLLSGPAEVVLGRDDELPDLVGIVRDHLARRTGTETIEPSLVLEPGVVFDGTARVVPPTFASYQIASLTMRATGEPTGLRLGGVLGVAPGADPVAVTTRIQAEATRLASNALVQALGVAGILSRLTLTAEDGGVRYGTSATWPEMSALLQLIIASTSS